MNNLMNFNVVWHHKTVWHRFESFTALTWQGKILWLCSVEVTGHNIFGIISICSQQATWTFLRSKTLTIENIPMKKNNNKHIMAWHDTTRQQIITWGTFTFLTFLGKILSIMFQCRLHNHKQVLSRKNLSYNRYKVMRL